MTDNCKKTQKLILKYIDGDISKKDSDILNEHIKNCADCYAEFEAFNAIKNDVVNLGDAPLPKGFEAKLHLSLAKEAQNNEKHHFPFIPIASAAVSFALIFAVMVGIDRQKTITDREFSDVAVHYADSVKEEPQQENEQMAEPKIKKNSVKTYSEPSAAKIVDSTAEQATNAALDIQTDAVTPNDQQNVMPKAAGSAISERAVNEHEVSALCNDFDDAMYGEYEIQIAENSEIYKTLLENFEITDNEIICDENEFNKLCEILNNAEMELTKINDSENCNTIKIKLTDY